MDRDLFVPADTNCFITSTGSVDGDIQISDGTSSIFHGLLIAGTVDGDITVVGGPSGSPLARVVGGTVNGDIMATNRGFIQTTGTGATINGDIESARGTGLLGTSTTVNGDIISLASGAPA